MSQKPRYCSPHTNNIADDYEKAEEHMLSYGWTMQKKGYDTLYYCRICSGKDVPKQQGRFIQKTLCHQMYVICVLFVIHFIE